MTAGGSPSYLHEVAGRLRQDAGEVKSEASKTREALGVMWSGTSSDSYRAKLDELAKRLDQDHDGVLQAAESVDALAQEVSQVQAAIQAAAHLVQDAMAQAQRTVQSLGDIAWDVLTGNESAALDRAQGLLQGLGHLPESGSPVWLDLAQRVKNR